MKSAGGAVSSQFLLIRRKIPKLVSLCHFELVFAFVFVFLFPDNPGTKVSLTNSFPSENGNASHPKGGWQIYWECPANYIISVMMSFLFKKYHEVGVNQSTMVRLITLVYLEFLPRPPSLMVAPIFWASRKCMEILHPPMLQGL